jgi:hypothetical protein
MRRTSPDIEQQVLAHIMLGYAYPVIAEKTGVAVSTIKKIKARHGARLEAGKAELTKRALVNATVVLDQVYSILFRRMDGEGGRLSVDQLISLIDLSERAQALRRGTVQPKPVSSVKKELDDLMAILNKN